MECHFGIPSEKKDFGTALSRPHPGRGTDKRGIKGAEKIAHKKTGGHRCTKIP
jgi:hypothetical protein